MMLWFNGRPAKVDGFVYYLAHQLHLTVSEVEAMPHQEYLNWSAYFTAKHAVENLRPVR
jgi:hypothetical protein